MTKTCIRPGCDREIYTWLHPHYCSRTCEHRAGAEREMAELLTPLELAKHITITRDLLERSEPNPVDVLAPARSLPAAPAMTPDLLAAKADAEDHGYTGSDTIDLAPTAAEHERCGPYCHTPRLCLQPEHDPSRKPVRFDEPKPRGWLARALERIFQ